LSWRKFFRQKELEDSEDGGQKSTPHSFDYKAVFYKRPYNRNLAVELEHSSTLNTRNQRFPLQGWVMDVVRPNIIVREKCACREDCGAEYELKVQLLKSNEEFDVNVTLPRFRTLTRSWNQWEGGKFWETVEHVYSDYPCGMRKLAVMSRGKDTLFWAGYYGAKFGATEVLVTFPENTRELLPEDFPDEEKKYEGGPGHPLRSLRVPVGLRGRFRGRRGF
uniref:FBA domain-containing protein n=1 Tax=Heligmosomoides polygyrus TaxID=6339 RepID=A0A183G6G9_HELPZ